MDFNCVMLNTTPIVRALVISYDTPYPDPNPSIVLVLTTDLNFPGER